MKYIILLLPLLTGCSVAGMFIPSIKVMVAEQEGKAELARAEFSKKIQIQDAMGKQEAAEHLAKAEVIRADGVAKANAIIGSSLKDNEAYLRWLYIEGLKERNGIETIYIPTEAGIPILEAGKRGK